MIGREETGGSHEHGHVAHQHGRLGGTGLRELADDGVRDAEAVPSPTSRAAADRLGSTRGEMFAEANQGNVPSPSRPGESHPEPLTDPDLSLSTHPARTAH
jgi:hypothetical protein